jgi:hypothetical protein
MPYLSEDVGQPPFMCPSFTLEHLEHSDLVGAKRISFDLLQPHRDEPSLARLRDFVGREAISLRHLSLHYRIQTALQRGAAAESVNRETVGWVERSETHQATFEYLRN